MLLQAVILLCLPVAVLQKLAVGSQGREMAVLGVAALLLMQAAAPRPAMCCPAALQAVDAGSAAAVPAAVLANRLLLKAVDEV